MTSRIVYLATRNAHKREEIAAMIAAHNADGDKSPAAFLDLRLCSELGDMPPWVEDGKTFVDNARIKARAVREHTRSAVLADDSGLQVEGLDGAPGVQSQRFAGEGGDNANNQKLLDALKFKSNAERRARFVCCLCFIGEDGNEHIYSGTCTGSIGNSPKGKHGFGYDPLFVVDGHNGRTMAELTPDEKNAESHRARAVQAWLADSNHES